jgi:PAS domain S-box-containing protein
MNQMENSYKILIVEDLPSDAELNKRETRKVLPNCSFVVVETEEDFIRELLDFKPDIILSDYSMPKFDGLSALRIALEKDPITPVIIITGSVNEDTAVECMKAGASNYVIKEQIKRLGPAILHALEEKQLNIERVQAQHALVDSLERYRALFNLSPVGIQLGNENGIIDNVNDTLCHMLGYTRDELIGQHVSIFVSPENRHVINENIKLILDGAILKYETESLCKDGTKINVELSEASATLPDGTTGIMTIVVDISKRKLVENELIIAKEKAEESDRLKTAFLNNISHEVRTPLNGILGFSSFICDPGLSDEERLQFCDVISRSSDDLTAIIDDIICISTIEAKQEKVNESEIDLNDFMNKLHSQIKESAELNQIDFTFSTSLSSHQSKIITDKIKLHQILSRLINNALKHTTKGTIEFGADLEKDNLTFYVKDTGTGIAKEFHEVIFNRFMKIESDPTTIHRGNGIGLSICKAYVELMGGTITVESTPNVGSTFYFTLPYNPVILKDRVEKSPRPNKGDTPKTILIAEDEYSNYLLLQMYLAPDGYVMLFAKNGKEAIDAVTNNPDIDLVLMDIKMSIMDGLTATSIIKKMRPDLPVVAQTAFAVSGDYERIIAAGCDEYISKPISKDKLLSVIKKYL